jgi:energy-coupling factor transporter transmembrane protein EcfT
MLQAETPTPTPNQPTISIEGQITGISVPSNKPDPWTTRLLGEDFTPVLLIVVFVIVVIAQIRLAGKRVWNSTSVRLVGITTIAFIGVFAALTVDNPQNGPAVFGLLGTIAGYLLGRTDKDTAEKDSKTPKSVVTNQHTEE